MVMSDGGYSLVVITDEPTALAGSIPTGFGSSSVMVVVTCLMIVLIAGIIIGAARAISIQRLQARLSDLEEISGVSSEGYNPRSMRSIRNQILALENDIAEDSLGGVIPSFHVG